MIIMVLIVGISQLIVMKMKIKQCPLLILNLPNSKLHPYNRTSIH